MFLKSQPKLILASTSAYRRLLLERFGVAFECAASGVDETALDREPPQRLVRRLAHAKAMAVARGRPEAWVIGSDQIALLRTADGTEHIHGKPGTAERCAAQLRASSGHTVEFITAVAVLRAGGADAPESHEFTDTTRVRFRRLEDATIARYIERESPLDVAGGFKSEGLGIALCESIDSADPTALIGLPLIRLAATLRTCGLQIP